MYCGPKRHARKNSVLVSVARSAGDVVATFADEPHQTRGRNMFSRNSRDMSTRAQASWIGLKGTADATTTERITLSGSQPKPTRSVWGRFEVATETDKRRIRAL